MKNFKCFVCEESNWHNIDEIRHKPAGMIICKNCGFVTYERAKDKEALRKYYEMQYRGSGPQAGHLITAGRKLEFVKPYMQEICKEFKEKREKDMKYRINILDVGCGIGYILNLCRMFLLDKQGNPFCKLYGTEWTESFRRIAYHMYGINSTQEVDLSQKYRLIISYHVLEHQIDPLAELMKYQEILEKDEHYLFMSVPVWGNILQNWDGSPIKGNQLFHGTDYLYHPDHINVWRKEHFEYLMDKGGFELQGGDDYVYGYTGVYKRGKRDIPLKKLDWRKVMDLMAKEKEAVNFYNQGKPLESIKYVPAFPEAYIMIAMKLYNGKLDMQMDYLEKGLKVMPKSEKLHLLKGTIHAQYEQWDQAQEHFKEALKVKPNAQEILLQAANMEKARGNVMDSLKLYDLILKIDPSKFVEMMDQVMNIWGKMPTENEQKVMEKIDKYASKEVEKAMKECRL